MISDSKANKQKSIKAAIAQVPFGAFGSIEGLMDENGNYYVGVSQASSIFDVPQKNASRDFKALLGNELTFLNAKVKDSRVTTKAISIAVFEILLAKLDRKGNVQAQLLRDALVGLSLHQLFSDAFNVEVTKEERQFKLDQFFKHNKAFHPRYTSWLKADGCASPKEYAIQVNRLKLCARLPLKPITEYDGKQLSELNDAEVRYDVLRKIGMDHISALAVI